jgi:FKBP-type peptidyl-prolyl cis-trans isomerase 2
MGSGTEKRVPRDLTRLAFVAVIVGIVLAGSAIGYVSYTSWTASSSTAPRAIIAGDKVTLEYIGRLPDGRVFDTSIASVAQDDALYPKSLTFTLRDNSSYTPFTMTAGYYGSGGTIKGFAQGVIGLHVGDHVIIDVPPDEGYPLVPSMVTTFNVTDTIRIVDVMSVAQFTSLFGIAPVAMEVVTHPFWQWQVLVSEVANGTVVLRNEPYIGENVYPYGNPNMNPPSGWQIRVIGYDPSADNGSGAITIKNMVTPSDVYYVKGEDSNGNALIIWSFDEQNQTFQVHRSDSANGYNAEVAGRTLYFEITIAQVVAGVS